MVSETPRGPVDAGNPFEKSPGQRCSERAPAGIVSMTNIAMLPVGGNSIVPNFDQAHAYVAALTGDDPNGAIIDVRMIHDVRKDVPAIPMRGKLPDLWPMITGYQSQGYGAFININQLDGEGRELPNVQAIRAHAVDLDNASAFQNYERAAQWTPAPSFAVATSPGKLHVYWCVQPYIGGEQGNRYASSINRRLRLHFGGDKSVIDPSRVLRIPGTLHLKHPDAPHLVSCWTLPGFNHRHDVTALDAALSNVPDLGGDAGVRHELGDPSLLAPSLDHLVRILALADPNSLDRGEWIAITAAFKQAGWSLTDDGTLRRIWDEWCARYDGNDLAENDKQWRSIRDSQLGWSSLVRRFPAIMLSGEDRTNTAVAPTAMPTLGEILTPDEQRTWFAGCTLIGPENRIIDAKGQFYDVGAFNSTFGGKRFVITSDGRMTDEAWKAATRSTVWTVPKVDGTSFRPDLATGNITTDELGRRSVNIFIPATIERMAGDPTPFLNHLAKLIPNPNDQRILLDYMAHNAKFPGHKIPWAPVIQSAEGAGKNIIKYAMTHVMGDHYTYPPNPKELAAGGGKFNDWMHCKLFLIADEIKTDDKRDLVEVLKPMISETTLEMQGKGRDQRKADNPANWMFFTNWKDAIPVHANGRRFAIFYSAIQSQQDALDRGMNDAYFKQLYDDWLGAQSHRTGLKIIADYLLSFPIERGAIPMRAPATTSMAEAITESRGWLETMIAEAVEDQRNGFRAGWISTAAVAAMLRERRKEVAPRTIGEAIKALGYHRIGQAGRCYFQDDPNRRGWLWNIDPNALIVNYGRAQNYE